MKIKNPNNMLKNSIGRRTLLTRVVTAVAMAGSSSLHASVLTPSSSEGPYYPREKDLPGDLDNDLVRVADSVKQAGGQILHLSGLVVDGNGKALPGTLIEIWQCDVNGRYIHGRDWSLSRDRDPNFQGYGKTITSADGRYTFRTIKPVPYAGRTPHIHVKAQDPRNGEILTTQMYVADEAQNHTDGLYRYMNAKQQQAVTVSLTPAGNGDLKGEFRIVL